MTDTPTREPVTLPEDVRFRWEKFNADYFSTPPTDISQLAADGMIVAIDWHAAFTREAEAHVRLQAAHEWQPIETLSDADELVEMWTPIERLYSPPLLPSMKPDRRISTRRMWTWATHWRPLPPPPRSDR